jgi:inner membrane protein
MDPVSQGVLGAVAPMAAGKKNGLFAGVLGLLSGMAADLDVLIRSETDPLLFLEFHRQFTHSLIFIPVGGLICALLLYGLFARRRLNFAKTYLFCTLGYATHGLLDSCTSYGTQLFWPFSSTRIAWHNISIIDPVFTLPILLCVVVGALRNQYRWGQAGLLWAVVYLGFGMVQRERAEMLGVEVAATRGHTPVSVEAKPSFGNLLLWKSIYEHDGYYYIDAVRVAMTTKVFPGEAIQKLDLARDFPWLDRASQQARDVERFRWFSAGYLAKSPTIDGLIVDMRYSMIPNRGDGLWGIQLSRDAPANAHIGYRMMRDASEPTRNIFLAMVFDNYEPISPSFRPPYKTAECSAQPAVVSEVELCR